MTHILIVEDLPALADETARVLQEHDPTWVVTPSSSLGEVNALLNTDLAVDLALVDLDLGAGPNASGLDALEALTELRPQAHQVIYTADAEGNRWLTLLAALSIFQPRGFISKGSSPASMVKELDTIAQGRRGHLASLGDPELEWFRALIGDKGDFNMWRALSEGAATTAQIASSSHFAIRTVNRFLKGKAELIAHTPLAGRHALGPSVAQAGPNASAGRSTHLLPVSTIATAHPLVFQSDLVEEWAELH